ncbi:MAG: hypothetical protein LBM93_09215 [Oscillospiraceae bacterium]|jgi:hypothetical protein|nr:hypothetical protein [Oscillospiraceae bacterium]
MKKTFLTLILGFIIGILINFHSYAEYATLDRSDEYRKACKNKWTNCATTVGITMGVSVVTQVVNKVLPFKDIRKKVRYLGKKWWNNTEIFCGDAWRECGFSLTASPKSTALVEVKEEEKSER